MVAVVDWSEWAEGEWVNIMIVSSTTATTVIINEWAVGEGVSNNDGSGGNIDHIDGGGGNDDDITSFFLSFWKFENFGVDSAADLRILTPYRVELIDKRLIFGLDSAINW